MFPYVGKNYGSSIDPTKFFTIGQKALANAFKDSHHFHKKRELCLTVNLLTYDYLFCNRYLVAVDINRYANLWDKIGECLLVELNPTYSFELAF